MAPALDPAGLRFRLTVLGTRVAGTGGRRVNFKLGGPRPGSLIGRMRTIECTLVVFVLVPQALGFLGLERLHNVVIRPRPNILRMSGQGKGNGLARGLAEAGLIAGLFNAGNIAAIAPPNQFDVSSYCDFLGALYFDNYSYFFLSGCIKSKWARKHSC